MHLLAIIVTISLYFQVKISDFYLRFEGAGTRRPREDSFRAKQPSIPNTSGIDGFTHAVFQTSV